MLKKVASLVVVLAAIVNGHEWNREFTISEIASLNAPKLFESWTQHFSKSYKNEEEKLHRFQVWLHNLDRISKHNSDTSQSFKMKLNQFGDLTLEEFEIYVEKGLKKNNTPKRRLRSTTTTTTTTTLAPAASVDWTAAGKVTPVKNQGQCGGCWSFSATGATECNVAIKTGVLTSLSEQQLLDCCTSEYGNYYSSGCDGGAMDDAFSYIVNNKGLCSEAEYPFLGYDSTCKTCATKYDPLTSYYDVTIDNEIALESAVTSGCVSVGIEADSSSFQFYSSGIFSSACGTAIDHGVLLVGYGVSGTTQYWKIKNSWGTDWGEAGYILFCKTCAVNNGEGQCGLYLQASRPRP